ncbi:biosynthetic arginine decarboxylase [Desulfobulbus rhabdoformis]|uniref:biosynthetic arginine decarboxylase n=1 Tax=Desulfobulbus rhabdoformis TaxID=34032 RepID=UPI001965C850|nr:biosynthetic arginine decarboxylase [Desulfobulbus rhabdoformis]MBM9616535.1 biosynthetic arginine decarboxylase [Desulfobulbus rhabdoformis]
MERWNINKSSDLYGVTEWSGGYFFVAENGDLMVAPASGETERAVSIAEVSRGMRDRGFDMPVLLRIENILDSQITLLNETFCDAMSELGYKGSFMGAYPIKVNQQQQVVEKIAQFGSRYHHGLEAGSKAELIAAMGMMRDKKAVLICNGYKDEEFIDLGLYATKIGYTCILVVEMPDELPLIIERSKKLKARPILGIRIKLSAQAGGHWAESGGERSIFGLNTSQVIHAVDMLKEAGMLDCLKLVHYHLGSQISNIREIRTAVNEACRVYAGLAKEGAAVEYLDLGGGLAVDYDGSQSNFLSSRNYTLKEYCTDIVEAVMTSLEDANIPAPVIITESGRALVAYYSILLFNILDVTRFEPDPLPDTLPEDCPPQLEYMHQALKDLTIRNIQEVFNDTIFYRDETRRLFQTGKITLRERSLAERLFWTTINRISRLAKDLRNPGAELSDLDRILSDFYYCNFSVFQSLPDSWAIEQLFPIMPIHRLDEEPTRKGILADITCDCDGKIDQFIDKRGVKHYLPLHELKPYEEYILGAFLVGAYQETLGDLHNLLGDTNIVTIRIKEQGEFEFVNEQEGDTVAEVLSYVQYDPKRLFVRFRETAEQAVREGKISPQERREVVSVYEAGLRGYTYFER